MKLHIGETIKALRREKGITQEELAEIVGVSCQSVSRWENDTCYPDLELLPELANYFGITVDGLLGNPEDTSRQEIQEYLNQFQNAVCRGDISGCIDVARAGVARYPGSYALLNKLMYGLFLAGDDTGNIPDWQENQKRYQGEIITLGERIIKHCPDLKIRMEATVRLARQYCFMGQMAVARELFDTLPSYRYCRELWVREALDPKEWLETDQALIRGGYEMIQAGLYNMVQEDALPPEAVLEVLEAGMGLDDLLFGENLMPSWALARQATHLAKAQVQMGKTEEAIQSLQQAAEVARAFDNRPKTMAADYLLLGNVVRLRQDFDTADSRPLVQILREDWLTDEAFDPIRGAGEFQQLLKSE